jgi:hypothetical protein
MMLVTECAAGVPEFWASERLCSVVPKGLLECLEHQEPRAMRLVVHHAFIPLLRSCPPMAAPRWLAPALRQILPVVQMQLQNMWVERESRAEAKIQGNGGTQTEDDIVQEVCLHCLHGVFASQSFRRVSLHRLNLLSKHYSMFF